jgi:hypothetical protein
MSFNEDGKEVLIPTVAANGSRILSERDAIAQYRRTGQFLGKFDTPDNATSYAQQLHQSQAQRYSPSGSLSSWRPAPGAQAFDAPFGEAQPEAKKPGIVGEVGRGLMRGGAALGYAVEEGANAIERKLGLPGAEARTPRRSRSASRRPRSNTRPPSAPSAISAAPAPPAGTSLVRSVRPSCRQPDISSAVFPVWSLWARCRARPRRRNRTTEILRQRR